MLFCYLLLINKQAYEACQKGLVEGVTRFEFIDSSSHRELDAIAWKQRGVAASLPAPRGLTFEGFPPHTTIGDINLQLSLGSDIEEIFLDRKNNKFVCAAYLASPTGS